MHSYDASLCSSVLRPAKSRSHLDCDSGGYIWWKHLVTVTLILTLE